MPRNWVSIQFTGEFQIFCVVWIFLVQTWKHLLLVYWDFTWNFSLRYYRGGVTPPHPPVLLPLRLPLIYSKYYPPPQFSTPQFGLFVYQSLPCYVGVWFEWKTTTTGFLIHQTMYGCVKRRENGRELPKNYITKVFDGLLIVQVLAHRNFRELAYKRPHVLFTKQLLHIAACYWVVTGLFRFLLGCYWVVPLVTRLFRLFLVLTTSKNIHRSPHTTCWEFRNN